MPEPMKLMIAAGIRVHGSGGNILIPEIVRRKRHESVQAGALPEAHSAATRRRISAARRSHLQILRSGSRASGIGIHHRDGKCSGRRFVARRRELRGGHKSCCQRRACEENLRAADKSAAVYRDRERTGGNRCRRDAGEYRHRILQCDRAAACRRGVGRTHGAHGHSVGAWNASQARCTRRTR